MNEKQINKNFGKFLRYIREERGLSLQEVEKKAKVSNSYLSQVERGDRGVPSLKILTKLAKTYDMTLIKMVKAATSDDIVDSLLKNLNLDEEFILKNYKELSEEHKYLLKIFVKIMTTIQKRKEKMPSILEFLLKKETNYIKNTDQDQKIKDYENEVKKRKE